MKTSIHYPIMCAALLAVWPTSGLLAQETAPNHGPMGRGELAKATLVAEVTGINLSNREVTLKGPRGNEVTITAGPAVKRLNEVKVGDHVQVDYLVSVAAELRPPTPEEAQHPLVITEAAGRAGADAAPAAAAARKFKVVTTIEALSIPDQTVTVKGPLGRTITARVADPARLAQVHIGDTIVLVYTEALAVSLHKTHKKSE